MQLLIILALLLYGGKQGAGNILSEVKPVLESFGGEEMQQALKNAEEISTVLSAVQAMASPQQPPPAAEYKQHAQSEGVAFPLSPISSIADKDITYSLSKYISQN